MTTVGSAAANNYFGTADLGGNVFEWNDAVIFGSSRGLSGGLWSDSEGFLRSSARVSGPSNGIDIVGFRVASVPEPSALVLTVLFSAGLVCRRKR